jgi:hypothetical protein
MLSARTLGLTLAIVIGAATGANAANLVTNGGFETGDFTGWTTDSNPFLSVYDSTSGGSLAGVSAFQGDWFAANGCFEFCTFSQDLTTNPNGTYNLSFAFNPGIDTAGGAEMQVFWNGANIFDQVGGPEGWVVESVNGLVASGSSTELRFSGFQNDAFSGIDAVDVEAAAGGPPPNGGGVLPEPSTWVMLLLGFASLGLAGRRQARLA